MKKSIVLGILGLAAGAVSTCGQGCIFLDNYFSSTYNPATYDAEFGGRLLPAGFTIGLFYDPVANQNIVGSVAFDPTGVAIPTSLNPLLVAATGPGSTAPIYSDPSLYGYFSASTSFLIQPGAAVPPQSSYTIMLVAYNGSSYYTSTIRRHSVAVYIQDAAPWVAWGADIGYAFPANTPIFNVPEPGTLALAGLGGLSLWLMRRKQV